MQTRLLEYLHNSNILSRGRYEFQMKLTTENATYKLTNEVWNALNTKLIVGGIFCDPIMAYCCLH